MARFDDLQIEILHALWEAAYQPGTSWYNTISELEANLPEYLKSPAARVAIQALYRKGYLDNNNGRFGITPEGITFIEQGSEDPESTVATLAKQSERPDGGPPTGPSNAVIPASDRVVTLDHNGDPYREAIGALDFAVTAFREDHRLDNELGPEKSILLQTMELGQQSLKETQVRVATVFTTVINPLKIVLDRYKDSVAAGLITAGVDQLIPLIERAIGSVLTLIGIS